MPHELLDRKIDISVRDRMGRLIPGVEIKFAIKGKPAGQIDASEGRGRIDLPGTIRSPVDVTVTYKGEQKTAKIAFGQESYEFRYDTIVGPEGGHIALWVGCSLVAISVALAFTFSNPSPLQKKLIQALLSLGCGGFATELTGFIKVDMAFGKRLVIGAGGALAVFVILYFWNPSIR
jgi:hypothetical protein